MKRAVYAGSFDPITKGHMWVIEQGAKLFDELYVSVGKNPNKSPKFSFDERVDMIKKSTLHISNINYTSFTTELLVDYAKEIDANYILRGIRSQKDYEAEEEFHFFNKERIPQIETVYLFTPTRNKITSSSMVKGLVGTKGWEETISAYLTKPVHHEMLKKFEGYKDEFGELWEKVSGKTQHEKIYEHIVDKLSEEQRYYHNFAHIAHMIAEFKETKHLLKEPDSVEFAIWTHDINHDTKQENNEELSREFATGITCNSTRFDYNAFKYAVKDMIHATTKHKPPKHNQNSDLLYFLDYDLAIFGREEKEFDEYETLIRAEYSHVSNEDFKKGRTAVLNKFLKRNSIYFTNYFKDKYEKQAINNLERSVEKLSK